MENLDFRVYAVDFDGTICNSKWPNLGPANEEVIEYLKRTQKCGNKLILWTCRTGKMLEDAVNFCRENGLYFDAVNENLPEVTALYGGDSRKICADYYIDDKSVLPDIIVGIYHLKQVVINGYNSGKEKSDGIL